MKKIAILLILSMSLFTPAHAVQKNIAVKKIEKLVAAPDAELLIASGSSIILISNVDTPTARISISALDASGSVIWQKKIESQQDEIASAVTSDREGNIWLAGFASLERTIESATATATATETSTMTAENPDAVVAENYPDMREDLRVLKTWKISPLGEVIAQYTKELSEPGLINGISVNTSGISIVGQFSGRPFLMTANQSGVFSKMYFVGTSKTVINTVVRNSDSSSNLFGASSEKLGGKNLAGKRDGILMKVGKTGSITSVVRSSIAKGDRAWLSSDSNLLLSGYVKSGKVVESAITKFNTAFVPTWTIRIPSNGESIALSTSKNSYVALSSNSTIKSLIGWKPSKSQLLLLTFNTKGLITAASGISDLSSPFALSYSQELGIVGLAKSADQGVAVFKLSK
jgi:hypothetical protein